MDSIRNPERSRARDLPGPSRPGPTRPIFGERGGAGDPASGPGTDVPRSIRTPQQTAFTERYAEYLKTPGWRRRRDRSLRLANWHCERCPSKSNLQVHHKTYARLGAERDDDLEVLCRECHEGHHFKEGHETHLGVYIKLVSDALKGEPPATITDLVERVKAQCARLGLPYGTGQIDRAIALLNERIPFARPMRPQDAWTPPPPTREIGRAEAADICRNLKLIVPLRSIPSPERFVWQQTEDEYMKEHQ